MRNNFLVLIVALIIIVSMAGCTTESPEYFPEAKFELSTQKITISDSQHSELITATITKVDDQQIKTSFMLKFSPSNPEYVYVIDAETQEKITTSTTKILTESGRQDLKQFKIVGKKVSGQTESAWTVDLELIYKNTTLEKKTINVVVK